MKPRIPAIFGAISAICVCTAGDCGSANTTGPEFNTSQKEEVWAFVTVDGTQKEVQAKVIVKGCTTSSCTGATITSVTPIEWTTPFGTCSLHWHISGQITGDLISFTLNGNECETTIQGRSTTGGRINGAFGSATGTIGVNSMSWNGITTLFSSDGKPQSFNGSGYWVAYRCAGAVKPCDFPVP